MTESDREVWKARNRRRIKKNLIKLVIVAAIICAGIMGFIYWKNSQSGDETGYVYKETTVQHGDMNQGIEESGTVTLDETDISYDLTTTTDDDDDDSDDSDDDDDDSSYLKIEDVYAVQGQRISEGDKLFKLTDNSVKSVRRILEANVSDAAVTLAEAQSSYSLDSQTAANTKSNSETAASVAEDNYQTTIAELQNELDSYTKENDVLQRDIEICQSNLTDDDFNDAYDTLNLKLTSAENLYNSTDANNVDAYNANKTAYETALSNVQTYEDQIATWNETINSDMEQVAENEIAMSTLQEKIDYKTKAAEGEKTSAQLAGTLASSTYNNTVNSLSETVTEAQTAYDEAEQELEDFNAFVGDDGIIYSDGAGLVIEVNYEAGDELETDGVMLSYAKDDGYTISVDISEEDIPSVSVGEDVSISFTAYSDETYSGTVTVIGTSASDNHSTTVSYPVTIEIDGDTDKLYGGMTADVTFVTDSIEDVLYVSTKAIVEDGDSKYVYTKSGDDYELTPVTTGFEDNSNTQITDGLSEGDTVYIRSAATEDEEQLTDTSTDSSSSAASGVSGDSGSAASGTGAGSSGQQSPGNMGGDMPQGAMPNG